MLFVTLRHEKSGVLVEETSVTISMCIPANIKNVLLIEPLWTVSQAT